MTRTTKFTITLPSAEFAMVEDLQARLGVKTRVEVLRRGLRLLQEAMDRESLCAGYRLASAATRGSLAAELDELDHLVAEDLVGL